MKWSNQTLRAWYEPGCSPMTENVIMMMINVIVIVMRTIVRMVRSQPLIVIMMKTILRMGTHLSQWLWFWLWLMVRPFVRLLTCPSRWLWLWWQLFWEAADCDFDENYFEKPMIEIMSDNNCEAGHLSKPVIVTMMKTFLRSQWFWLWRHHLWGWWPF